MLPGSLDYSTARRNNQPSVNKIENTLSVYFLSVRKAWKRSIWQKSAEWGKAEVALIRILKA